MAQSLYTALHAASFFILRPLQTELQTINSKQLRTVASPVTPPDDRVSDDATEEWGVRGSGRARNTKIWTDETHLEFGMRCFVLLMLEMV